MPTQGTSSVSGAPRRPAAPNSQPSTMTRVGPSSSAAIARARSRSRRSGRSGRSMPVTSSSLRRNGVEEGQDPMQMPQPTHNAALTVAFRQEGQAVAARGHADRLIGAVLGAARAAIAMREIDHRRLRPAHGRQPGHGAEHDGEYDEDAPDQVERDAVRNRVERQEEPVEPDRHRQRGEIGHLRQRGMQEGDDQQRAERGGGQRPRRNSPSAARCAECAPTSGTAGTAARRRAGRRAA